MVRYDGMDLIWLQKVLIMLKRLIVELEFLKHSLIPLSLHGVTIWQIDIVVENMQSSVIILRQEIIKQLADTKVVFVMKLVR